MPVVDSVWQVSKEVVRLERANGQIGLQPNIHSAASDHSKAIRSRGGTRSRRKVGVEAMHDPEERLRKRTIPAANWIAEAQSGGEGNQ